MRRLRSVLLTAGGLGAALLAGTLLRGADPAPARLDLTKRVVEAPAKRLAAQSGAAPAAAEPFVNPKVQPGKVRWHADFATACTAAAKSGKPVLLLQMMGRLDDQFC